MNLLITSSILINARLQIGIDYSKQIANREAVGIEEFTDEIILFEYFNLLEHPVC